MAWPKSAISPEVYPPINIEIKSEMFSFCNDEEIDKNCLPEIKELIIKVHEFSNMYKRKPKK